ncbi:MAG: hypothetical protein H8E46_06525 [FCB group bacterium]|nr:hypothetical protein [FCB group bacterium]
MHTFVQIREHFGLFICHQAASCKLQAASYKLQAASYKLQAASYKLQAASCKLQQKQRQQQRRAIRFRFHSAAAELFPDVNIRATHSKKCGGFFASLRMTGVMNTAGCLMIPHDNLHGCVNIIYSGLHFWFTYRDYVFDDYMIQDNQ